MASRHRLMPLLYVNLNSICPEKVPEDILKDLKDFYLENTRKNLLLTSELVKVMKLLEDNRIDAVTYKGPVLAHSVYGNIGYRQFGDIDILIDKEDALEIKNLMCSEGYKLLQPLKVNDSTYINLESEYAFINKINEVKVEINWNFEGMFFSFQNNPKLLFNDLKELNINNFKFPSFSPNNQLLMLSIHAAKHNWTRLAWINDISELIQVEHLNWYEILTQSEKLGVKRILLVNLLLGSDLFGLKLPKEINDIFDQSTHQLVNQIKSKLFLKNKQSWTLFEKFCLDLKKRENLINGIKDCFAGFSRPSYNDIESIKLSKSLSFLYPFIRPFLLIKRYRKKDL